MAVYTQVSAENAAAFLAKYDVGELRAIKGIAEGVENSNYMVETTQGRYFLTLYESRMNEAELPFFHDLLSHLKQAGSPVPAFIDDRDGGWLQQLCGRPACLIEFLEGVSVSEPTPPQARAVGSALGHLHRALDNFAGERQNSLGIKQWRELFQSCDQKELEAIQGGLTERIEQELEYLESNWPQHLPHCVIHADLFPDNVLMVGDKLSGLIDFYFACSDIRAFDIAVTHAAWSFSDDGAEFLPHIGTALLEGYDGVFGIDGETEKELNCLFRGACLRFLLTRCYDWINTPKDALVNRKDPVAFLRRLDFYANPANKKLIIQN